MMPVRRPLTLFALVILAACADSETVVEAAFETPTGLAVAGSAGDRLFVANADEDSLQVVQLTGSLGITPFIDSQAIFFPLRIPAGPGPRDLAATADGRFVVVLDWVTDALKLVDADTLMVVEEGEASVGVGPVGARATDLVGSPQPCARPCSGRLYVSLAAAGAVVEVEVIDEVTDVTTVPPTTTPPFITPLRFFDVGGEPGALAISPDGNSLFVADNAAPELIRVDVGSGLVERQPSGARIGSLSVSTDGAAVIGGRPSLRDLVIFDGAGAPTFSAIDANAAFAPRSDCLDSCNAVDPGCPGAHPAELSVCSTGDGLATTGTSYGGLYLNAVPTAIQTLGVGAGHPGLTVRCLEDDSVAGWNEFAVVAALDGQLLFVGLRAGAGAPLKPELISLRHCDPFSASLSEITRDDFALGLDYDLSDLSEFLGDCPDAPDRDRFVCSDAGGGPGVVMMPNRTGAGINMRWEGRILVREVGGTIGGKDAANADDELLFHDTDDIGSAPIRAGDILQINSEPFDDSPDCDLSAAQLDSAGNVRACNFERRITGFSAGVLTLDAPIDSDCFRDGAIAYAVRAGDAFLVDTFGRSDRLGSNEVYGTGAAVGRDRSLLLRMKTFDPNSAVPACDRYDDLGGPGAMLDPILRRTSAANSSVDAVLRVEIDAALLPVRGGIQVDSAGNERTIGSIPVALLVADTAAADPALFVSFSGSDSVLGFVPFDPDAFFAEGSFALLD